ncbi:unnamed protein product [Rotaria sp. Silwood2]|nr:unnamed protein product [Rotaria sp. Silwood2]
MLAQLVLFAVIIVIVAVFSVGIGILIGHFAITKIPTDISRKYNYITRQENQQNYQTFINSIQAANIEAYLKDLASRPHIAGLPEDLESAQVIEQRWINDGLQVTKPKYNVLLSYPDDNNPNRVTLTIGNGIVIIETNGTEKTYDPTQPKTVNPFLAYTPNGTVSSTKLFYANYGRLEDLQHLASVVGNASLQGSIIIMRYGLIYRGNKIMYAQYFGAVGAILYNDPADYAPFGTTPDQVYDQKWYMPPSGAQRGSAYTSNGDPLTPIYPSTDYMYRLKEENVKFLPKIPAQPINYNEAQILLQYLQGREVPAEWRGALPNATYRYGEEFTYPADSWSLGAIDSTSGTATLLEITRAIGQMYKNGFRPRRSLMFCSWGAEEYGLIGSVEYVEISSAYDPPGQTIYDKWMRVHRNNITNEPKYLYGLGLADSDHYAFDQLVGSSNFDAAYQFNPIDHRNISMYPLYHTSYETFSMMKKFIDPDFTAHRTMGQFVGVLALILSETHILPFNVTRYTIAIKQSMKNIQQNDTQFLTLRNAISDFEKAAQDFVNRSKSLNTENLYQVRAYNDQLLQLERAFLNPLGQGPDYTDLKHIIYAPAKGAQYDDSGLPTISDAAASGNQTVINQEIAIVVYYIRGAISTLKQFDKFIS